MPRTKKKYNERIELGRAADGTRVRKWIRADTKPELEAKKKEAIREFKVEKNITTSVGVYSQKWFETYKANRALGTKEMYRHALLKLEPIAGKQVKDVTHTDLQEIMNANWEYPRACQMLLFALKQIFGCAIRDGILSGLNPADDLELPKRPKHETRIITDEEMKKILEANFTPRDRFYIDVLRYTGMRPSEVLALRWEDIDYKNKEIHVCRNLSYGRTESKIKGTKTDVRRVVPLHSQLASILKFKGLNEGYIFINEDENFNLNEYTKMASRIIRVINHALGKGHGIVLYSFRHTYATFLLYEGVMPGKISTLKASQIMGHSQQVFLSTYCHIDDSKESVQDVIEGMYLDRNLPKGS